jgi:hypothetical protein
MSRHCNDGQRGKFAQGQKYKKGYENDDEIGL